MLSFQQIILRLQDYWARQGCALLQPYDMEVGAGTSHTATFLRAIGPEPWKAAYVQPSRRPKDGRYGENPNRLQHYYQYQVVLKPAPADILDLYLGSLEALGFDLRSNDVRFVEDDWENPTLGCWGLGWEVWLNGMEVTQFTYFQQVGGIDCKPITGEITYGLERLAMYLQGVDNVYKLQWTDGLTYGDVYKQNEVEQSTYNFEHSDVDFLLDRLRRPRAPVDPPDGAAPRAAGLRAAAQGRPQLQPARRARGDQRHRTRRLHRAHPQPRTRGGAELPRQSGPARLPDGAAGLGGRGRRAHRCTEKGCLRPAMTTKNLLVELFIEELPPKALKMLGEAFARLLTHRAGHTRADHRAQCGDALRVAAPAGRALQRGAPAGRRPGGGAQADAGLGRARRRGCADASLAQAAGGARPGRVGARDAAPRGQRQGRGALPDAVVRGAMLADGLQRALDEAIARLPVPKLMQYQLADGWTSVGFVRPVHGLVALHGAEVVPVGVLGLTAGRQTHGHRFEAAMDPVVLQHADHYAEQLAEQGAVMAEFEHRRSEIVRQLRAAAAPLGLTPIDDPALLDEVTALVERPNVLRCQFEPEFLAVPQECLILTMKANQKYFPLLDATGRLTNQFLVVSNITPADPSRVIEGNERVVRPRLADAKLLLRPGPPANARRAPARARQGGLSRPTRQPGRAGGAGANDRQRDRRCGSAAPALQAQAAQAAQLAKADLLTDMVGEFPELQGIMGGYYARHDGLPDEIAFAIEDHYKPRFAGDALPRNRTGLVVALADKLETLVGLFGIGQMPTGDKDPFALRRHALGVIRMLVEAELDLSLYWLIETGERAMASVDGWQRSDALDELPGFFFDRIAGIYRDQGYSAQQVDAVIANFPPTASLSDLPRRLAAVRAFADLPRSTGTRCRQQAGVQHPEEGRTDRAAGARSGAPGRAGRTGTGRRAGRSRAGRRRRLCGR